MGNLPIPNDYMYLYCFFFERLELGLNNKHSLRHVINIKKRILQRRLSTTYKRWKGWMKWSKPKPLTLRVVPLSTWVCRYWRQRLFRFWRWWQVWWRCWFPRGLLRWRRRDSGRWLDRILTLAHRSTWCCPHHSSHWGRRYTLRWLFGDWCSFQNIVWWGHVHWSAFFLQCG